MTNGLRPYQQKTVDSVRAAIRAGERGVCVMAPTGSGKSVMAAALLSDPVPQMLVTHRRVLLDQLSATLTKWGVEHGIRAAGVTPNLSARVQLSMIQSDFVRSIKSNRWPIHAGCERLHIDEIHAVKGGMAQSMAVVYPTAAIVGWSATPRAVGHLCPKLIVSASVPDLITNGHLVPPIVFTPDGPSVDNLSALARNINGEFLPAGVDKVMKPKVILGRVAEWLPKTNLYGQPAVLFAPGVRQSLWFAQGLSAAGIPAAHVDAKQIWRPDTGTVDNSPQERSRLFYDLETGLVEVVCNRFVLREGWDCPAVGHVILATCFGSQTSFVQACGRGLRAALGKHACTFQDHGANFWRFPALDDDVTWDHLSNDERQRAEERAEQFRAGELAEPICCPQCSCLRAVGPVCPNCGHRHEMGTRFVLELNGRLVRKPGRLYKPATPVAAPAAESDWKRSFWAARKYRPNSTLRQVFAYHRKRNGGRPVPTNLPLMPRAGHEHLWTDRIGSIDLSLLR